MRCIFRSGSNISSCWFIMRLRERQKRLFKCKFSTLAGAIATSITCSRSYSLSRVTDEQMENMLSGNLDHIKMKYLKALVLLTLVTVSHVNATEQGKHLFILSGQSNMEGLQPEISFTPIVESELGKDNVIVILDADSSQSIRHWYKKWKPKEGNEPKATGDLYDRLLTKVSAEIKGTKVQTVTFVWMQGEQDALEQHGEVYAASLKGLLNQLGNDLGRNDVNFVIGRISDFDLENKQYPHWTLVRKAQVEVAEADPHGAWVDTDDLNDGKDREGKEIKNGLHYSAEGYKTLGKRFAQESIKLIKMNTHQGDEANRALSGLALP